MRWIKGALNKIRINSIYVRWTFLFTGIIMVSYFLTVLLSVHRVMPLIVEEYQNYLMNKAEFIRVLDEGGFDVTEETLHNIGDENVNIVIFDEENLQRLMDYKKEINLQMMIAVEQGEFVTASSEANFLFCIFKTGGRYILLEPNNNSGEGIVVALGFIQRVGAFTSAVLIVGALIIIIRPINKVISATKEVSAGNYTVEIPEKTGGDIGVLIHNFNQMTKSLYKNEYLKKDFVSNVSHEFKTPITSIEGFARLLQDEGLSHQERQEYTDIIIKESARLSHMAKNLLRLTELDSREFTPPRNWYYLDEQIRQIVLLLEPAWSLKNIGFSIEMEPVRICANEELLHQVWFNLLHNAIKFSPENGEISVVITQQDSGVSVAIKDAGPGMAPKDVEMIFERFYQADTAHATEGSGLGLSIVKRIVDLLGGGICCESRLGAGTVFTVTLPEALTENTGVNKTGKT